MTTTQPEDGLDVELTRLPSIRGVVGSVGRPDGGYVAVAILDVDWMTSGRRDMVDPLNPVVRLAASLAINEPGGENPWPLVEAKGVDHYRVDSVFFALAEERLAG